METIGRLIVPIWLLSFIIGMGSCVACMATNDRKPGYYQTGINDAERIFGIIGVASWGVFGIIGFILLLYSSSNNSKD